MTYPDSFDHMLAAWNEQDSKKIRQHLNKALAEDVHFIDPDSNVRGIDAFESMIHKVNKRIPDAVYSRISKVDTHHNIYRYHWAIHVDKKLLIQGFDVVEINEADKVKRVIGFFGDLTADLP